MSQHKINPRAIGAQALPARARDSVGRVLEPGDEVLVVAPTAVYRVAKIEPILHPGAPPNLMQVVLVTRLLLACARDGAIEDLYFLRHQAQIGDKAIEGAEQPAEPPAEQPEQPTADPDAEAREADARAQAQFQDDPGRPE